MPDSRDPRYPSTIGGQREATRALAYGGMAVALATVLSLVVVFKMPQGGSITAVSMFPLIVVALFFGPRWGFLTGAVFGLIQLVFGPYIVHPVQVLLDYPVAFGAVGLAGLFAPSMAKRLAMQDFPSRVAAIPPYAPVCGTLLALAGRYASHVVSGAVFFGSFAPEGQDVWLYSIVYNASYMVWEAVLHVAAAVVLTGFVLALRLVVRKAR